MSKLSYYKFKNKELWLDNAFFICFELLLFEQIQNDYFSDKELSPLKNQIAYDSLYMLDIGDISGLELDDFITSVKMIDVLIKSIDNIMLRISSDNSYFTSERIYSLANLVKGYLLENDNPSVDYSINSGFGRNLQSVSENYSHAFYLIKLLLKGELKHSDIDGRLVG